MSDTHLNRVLVHVAAILAAIAMWWIVPDFAAALGASLLAFLLITAIGHIAFGPMPTAEDVRRDVEALLRDRS